MESSSPEILALFLMLYLFMVTVPIVITLCEYYMCTFPLPPGEKEKKKAQAANLQTSSA
jgi:hypothetical protein